MNSKRTFEEEPQCEASKSIRLDESELIISLAFYNAIIWTGDEAQPKATAVAISSGKFAAVGSDADILAQCTKKTTIIDAKGQFMCPGFIDSHIHFLMGGARLSGVQLSDCTSKEQFIERIERYAQTLQEGEWIYGGDWDHTKWNVPEMPHKRMIDGVTLKNPVWLNRCEGHQYLANSLALQIAGVSSSTSEVEGGTIFRYTDEGDGQEPTGLFKDNALSLVYKYVPPMSEREAHKALEAATRYVHAYGVTSIVHMTEPADRNCGGIATDLAFFESAANSGMLRIRTYCAVPIQLWSNLSEKVEKNGFGDTTGEGNFLRWGALKAYVDGSLGSHTAAFLAPYVNRDDGYCGDLVNSAEDLFTWIQNLDTHGLQVFVHAIGDLGVRTCLDVFQKVAERNGPKDRRWRIEHAQHIAPSDIPRFAALGVHASVQPQHAADDGRWCQEVIGEERCSNGTYAFRSLLETGANIACGSDWFVVPPNPIAGIAAAVTRKTTSVGTDRFVFVPKEALAIEQALRGYTTGAAASVHEEHIKGAIKVGMLADVVLLDADITACPPEEIENTRVVMTVCHGKVVYDRESELREAQGNTEADRISRALQMGPLCCRCCH